MTGTFSKDSSENSHEPVKSKSEPRIALFLPSLRGGGAERVMINLAQGFVTKGVAVDLVLVRAEGPYLQQLPEGINVVDLNARRVRSCLPGLVRYFHQSSPTAMLSAMDHVNVVAVLAKLIAASSSRLVVTLHNTISEKLGSAPYWYRRALALLLRLMYPLTDGVIAVSAGVADDYVSITGLKRDQIKVIYNPVITETLFEKAQEDPGHPWFMPGQPPVIISVGTLTEQKDHAALFHAFARIKQKLPIRLMLLGEGPLRKELEKLAYDLNITEDLAMPGFVDNPFQYLASSAVFVLSSKWEGLPTVLIEALAVGVPVVSTDCKSGPNEILKGGKLGALVPVGDVSALAEAIYESLLSNANHCRPEDLNAFTTDTAVTEYLEALLE